MLGLNNMNIVKKIIVLFFLLATLLTPFLSFAHGNKVRHFEDFIGVFNGYGDKAFRKFSYTISSGIDHKLPEIFREQIGSVPGNHRILGHGWALNDSIPKETLNYLSKRYPGKEKEIINIWRTFANGITKEAIAVTGLPKAQANAFASLLYDIHLLGDLEPGNKLIDLVLQPQEIVKNINKDVQILFKNNPKYAKFVERRLNKVLRQMKGKDTKLIAQSLMDEFYRLRMGDMLHKTWGKTFKPQYSIERVIKANENLAKRTINRIPGVSSNKPQVKRANIKKSDFYKKSLDGKSLHAGLLLSDKRLLLAVKEGSKTALMIIAVEGGVASYQYIKGSILKPEFEEKMIDAAIKGTTVGSAIGVAILLGATPAGFIVFAVSSGVYYITETGITLWKAHKAKKYLTIEDLSAYGIKLDSTLDLEKDDIFSNDINSPLELFKDTTLQIKDDSTLSL